jgi:hypothetical protein
VEDNKNAEKMPPGPQGAKPKNEVVADILATIKERRA